MQIPRKVFALLPAHEILRRIAGKPYILVDIICLILSKEIILSILLHDTATMGIYRVPIPVIPYSPFPVSQTSGTVSIIISEGKNIENLLEVTGKFIRHSLSVSSEA